MEEQHVDNFNFGGGISQKLEHIKNKETLWNEYFTASLHYTLSNGNIYSKEQRESFVKSAATTADLMLSEYNARFHNE